MKLTTAQRTERSAQLGILVDDEDAWLLAAFTWKLIQGNPATTSLDREWTIYIQHFIIGIPIDELLVVDHRDQNKLNNRRSNLRYVTKQQNMLNHMNKDDLIRSSCARVLAYALREDNRRFNIDTFIKACERETSNAKL